MKMLIQLSADDAAIVEDLAQGRGVTPNEFVHLLIHEEASRLFARSPHVFSDPQLHALTDPDKYPVLPEVTEMPVERPAQSRSIALDAARKQLEKAEAAWADRPWDRQRQRDEARAQLTRVQREAEAQGQQTLLEEKAP